MGIWVCTNCNYRFNSEKGKECPYCGLERVEKEKSANELLNEIGELLK